jgi:hypothetical protein
MSFSHSPRISTNGLLLCLDAANTLSYAPGSTTWRDLSGYGNNGTLTNGPTFNSDNGGAIVFDGTDDFINCGDPASLRLTTAVTLCSWFNINAYKAWSALVGRGNAVTGVYVMQLAHTGQKIRFSYNSDSPWTVNIVDGNTTLVNGVWTYSAVTYDGSDVNMYINGRLDKTQNIGQVTFLPSAGYDVYLGCDPPGSNEFFNGRIASSQIYNRALSGSEILQNYEATKARFGL